MILPVEYPGGSYDIVLERGALARAAEYLPRTGKALIVTDDGVPAAYARQIASVCPGSTIVALPQGEKTKSLDNHRALLSRMLELNFLAYRSGHCRGRRGDGRFGRVCCGGLYAGH